MSASTNPTIWVDLHAALLARENKGKWLTYPSNTAVEIFQIMQLDPEFPRIFNALRNGVFYYQQHAMWEKNIFITLCGEHNQEIEATFRTQINKAESAIMKQMLTSTLAELLNSNGIVTKYHTSVYDLVVNFIKSYDVFSYYQKKGSAKAFEQFGKDELQRCGYPFGDLFSSIDFEMKNTNSVEIFRFMMSTFGCFMDNIPMINNLYGKPTIKYPSPSVQNATPALAPVAITTTAPTTTSATSTTQITTATVSSTAALMQNLSLVPTNTSTTPLITPTAPQSSSDFNAQPNISSASTPRWLQTPSSATIAHRTMYTPQHRADSTKSDVPTGEHKYQGPHQ